MVSFYSDLNDGGVMGYSRCWSAEIAFSIFKRLYGEYSIAKT